MREEQVLHGIAIGASHREIAGALYISLPTVRSHVRTLYKKLDVNDSVAVVGRSRELGLLPPARDANIDSAHRVLFAGSPSEPGWDRIRSLTGGFLSGT